LLRERGKDFFIFVSKRNKKAQLVFGNGVVGATMASADFCSRYKGWGLEKAMREKVGGVEGTAAEAAPTGDGRERAR
jgi:hypothetical protein